MVGVGGWSLLVETPTDAQHCTSCDPTRFVVGWLSSTVWFYPAPRRQQCPGAYGLLLSNITRWNTPAGDAHNSCTWTAPGERWDVKEVFWLAKAPPSNPSPSWLSRRLDSKLVSVLRWESNKTQTATYGEAQVSPHWPVIGM